MHYWIFHKKILKKHINFQNYFNELTNVTNPNPCIFGNSSAIRINPLAVDGRRVITGHHPSSPGPGQIHDDHSRSPTIWIGSGTICKPQSI